MKTIKIAHLYYDLMNLYGENGNVRCLEKYLKKQSINVEISYLTKDDTINFDDYDIFYIGSGNKDCFNITLKDIKKYKNDIEKALKDKFFIATGNSINLFGQNYINKKNITPCLDVLSYSSKEIKKRFVGDGLYKTKFINNEIIGFENRDSILTNVNEETLFNTIIGNGNSKHESFAGIKHNNFYGTYLLGPLLIRNPYFTNYLIKEICKKFAIEFKEVNDEFEIQAYNNYLNILKEK